jgi:cell division transport system ATP-binding protein
MSAIPSRPVIFFQDVSARYDERWVCKDISLDIHMGEFVYVVGPTGSGKSTLLRLIYADLQAASGQLRVGEFDLNPLVRSRIPYLRRKLGVVFQDFQLLPDRTVYDNIYFALRATGWKDTARIKQRVSEVLVNVGMSGKNAAMPHQLSGGEQQRVAIARALINDPIVLIADEPTGNLDPQATAHILDILRKINQSGTAVLMATHEYAIIEKYPSRILELLPGGGIADHSEATAFLQRTRV